MMRGIGASVETRVVYEDSGRSKAADKQLTNKEA